MPRFRLDVAQNPYLPLGATEVQAIVTVSAEAGVPEPDGAAGEPAPAPEAAVVVIVDTSASMYGEKIRAARRAARAAVDTLRDGVSFAIVSGAGEAAMVYPDAPRLVPATDDTRAEARHALDTLAADGGTRMGAWLRLAADLFTPFAAPGALRHAILLTDGQNNEQPDVFESVLDMCAGLFVCDCRGVGTDWNVADLRWISSVLLGSVDIVADPADLEADFRSMAAAAMAKGIADVRLRLWTPDAARVRFVRQVAPTVEDLTARRADSGPRSGDYPTGAWGGETRVYHIGVVVPMGAPGRRMRAGWVRLLGPASTEDTPLAAGNILAEWTGDEVRATQIDPRVAHYTGQVELARAIQEGLRARRDGDEATATQRLGRAVVLARRSGDQATASLLRKVVDVIDPKTGTVRLRPVVDRVDEMTLDTHSTRTVRTRGGDDFPGAG
ncbi:vWA domain-containing protein [Nocardiopsis mwathae]|uniref:vWA domain-containing protein n=1 Tax=Nocardiopsis mwathae TaxID=1472723 RepID=UPI001610C842|nr:VWA domain-containing protein [Nocardiopsis mwathae]